MSARYATLATALLLVPALAGCTDDAPAAGERIDTGSTGSAAPSGASGEPTTTPPPVATRPRGTSERWHFHDHWLGNPTITLFEGTVTFNATLGADGLPALSSVFELPHGTIVPPETGYLTFNVTWDAETAGLVNLTYKPADTNDFQVAGDLEKGVPFQLNTTESNCDVPHRQSSAWKFNLTAKPGGMPPALPPRDVHVNITATIGRPLFIDPPHLNWWRDGDVIPIVQGAAGNLTTARTPAANLTLPPGGLPDPNAPHAAPSPATLTATARVPVDEGRIVPEGTKSIVAILNWTSPVPDAKPALRFWENNYPSEGPMEVASEGEGTRTFVLKVAQAQTDTTYSNRTTWEFRIVPEGEAAGAFEGSFTLVAWATRLEPAAAVAAVGG